MLTWTLGALVLASTAPVMSFEQPPATTVLQLVSANGRAQPVRLNLPAIIETVRLEAGHRLSLLARAEIPASVEIGTQRYVARVSLGAAQGKSGEGHRVRLSRALTVRSEGLELELLLDMVLAPEPSALGEGELIVEKSAVVAVAHAGGKLVELELARHAYFAHPAVPMRWTAPGSIAKWKAQTREGWLVLGEGLYPEAFVDNALVTVLLDAGGDARSWRLRVEAGKWTDGERVIEWSKEPGRWVGRVRGFDAPGALSLRLGDADSPMSVDLVSSELPAGERAGL